MNRKLAVIVALLMLVGAASHAQVIRLASAAPESSPWGAALNRLAADWQRISNGRVTLQIFHNGIAGDEPDVLRKMRIGQIQAGVFTSSGMSVLAPEVMALSMPMMIRSDDELDHVFAVLQEELEQAISRNRFTVLGWSKAGWIYFFTSRPIQTPDDLKTIRIAASAENEDLLQAFRLMGYQAFPIAPPELLTSLNSGMVEGFYTSPIAAAGFQWFARAPYMLDLPVAPFLGSLVIADRAWSRIPDNLKTRLVASVQTHMGSLDNTVEQLEQEAIQIMSDFGLTTTALTPEQQRLWFTEFDRSRSMIVGSVFDEGIYQSIQRQLQTLRR